MEAVTIAEVSRLLLPPPHACANHPIRTITSKLGQRCSSDGLIPDLENACLVQRGRKQASSQESLTAAEEGTHPQSYLETLVGFSIYRTMFLC